MQTVRIKFKKIGRARYISHLDLSRCMARAIKRSGLPFWYTQGFNPHPYITFALPLPIFCESLCEFMDARIVDDMPFETIKDRLSSQLPEGLVITEVFAPVMKPAEVAFAAYDIELAFDGMKAPQVGALLSSLLCRENIVITKTTKHSFREYDIKPYLSSAQKKIGDGSLFLKTVLPASQRENLSPSCFSAAFELYVNRAPDLENILRAQIYNRQMEPFR